MFAIRNTFKHPIFPVFLGVLLHVSCLQAQQPPADLGQETDNQESPDTRRMERLGDVSADEWEMNLALPKAAPAAKTGKNELLLPDAAQNKQLQQLLSQLAANPGNSNVLRQLNALLSDVLQQANGLLDNGDFQQAQQLLLMIQSINPALPGFDDANKRVQALGEIIGLLTAGDAALESQRVTEPQHDNALYYFNRVLDTDPENRAAQLGLEKVQAALVELALDAARNLDFEAAETLLTEASTVRDDQQVVINGRDEMAVIRHARALEVEQEIVTAMDTGDFKRANMGLIDLMALGEQGARVDALRARLEEARLYGGFEPGQIISDELLNSGGKAPDIVIVAAGSFLMGSKTSENEEPPHRVTFSKGFGIGVREVTVAEFRTFIERTGYRTTAERSGRSSVYSDSAGRLNSRTEVNWKHDYRGERAGPDLPVIHVSHLDASAYVQWLVSETGKGYHLPSEAEFEYVARAGSTGSYWWGEGPPAEAVENLTGERDRSPGKREWTTSFKKYDDGYWGPAPAGSLKGDELVHPMGVFDIAGNVSEWTEDCWHENYVKAPTDGSAWVNRGCERRVIRGGYWASAPQQSRAAYRMGVRADSYGAVVGFRVARDL